MTRKYIYLLVLTFLINSYSFCQPAREPEDAHEFFRVHNYLMALPIYKFMATKDSVNPDLNYRLGVCHIETHLNRVEAAKYFEIALRDPKCPVDAWFHLGRAYHLAYKFEEAVAAFEKYKTLIKSKEELEKANREIENCHHAVALMANPRKVSFTNLGGEINTQYPDYFPWVTDDDQLLFYTSRRKGGHASQPEIDGYFPSDIFFAVNNGQTGKWEKAKNLGSGINTSYDEEVVGMSPDGKELVIYIDNLDQKEDLFLSVKKGNGYSRLEPFNSSVNKEKEYSGSIANSKEGQVLFFVRKDKNSNGQTDIYMSRRMPGGQWGPAFNLGSNINTPYKEDFPWLSQDGKTLYFSSEGHNSMGGYDLFKSEWDEEMNNFGPAENLGYPINTPDDEQQISILPDKRAGYMSCLRPDGFGDLDIYRVKFLDEPQPYGLITGRVILSDSSKTKSEITITAEDEKTQEQFFFKPIPTNHKYVMALHPGKYKLTIECDGYRKISEILIIVDIGLQTGKENPKDFILFKQ